MKRIVLMALISALVLMPAVFAARRENVIPASGPGQIGWQAIVITESLAVREEADADSKEVNTLDFGTLLIVTEQRDGMGRIVRSDAVDAVSEGWVETDHLMIDPSLYRAETPERLYAWNDASAPVMRTTLADTILPILRDDGDWLAVAYDGAVGWISIEDAG